MPRPGAEDRLVPPRRAPAGRHIDRLAHQGPVPRVVAPVAYPTAFWVQQPGDGRQADRVPPRVLIQVDAAHPPHSRACWRREPRLTRSGRETPGPAARAVAPGPSRRGRGLAGPGNARAGAHRLAALRPRPRGRRAAVTRRYPQGSVRGTELSPDEKDQSASSGGSRRHPARRLVVARPPGTPAHRHTSTGRAAVPLATSGLLPREPLPHPHPSRSTPLLLPDSPHHHSRRCGLPGAQPPGPQPTRRGNPPHPRTAE